MSYTYKIVKKGRFQYGYELYDEDGAQYYSNEGYWFKWRAEKAAKWFSRPREVYISVR